MPKSRKGAIVKATLAPKPECPTLPMMTEEEIKASRLAYEQCKPKLEAALGKLNVTVKGVIGVRKA
jgi:hypothetical protein